MVQESGIIILTFLSCCKSALLVMRYLKALLVVFFLSCYIFYPHTTHVHVWTVAPNTTRLYLITNRNGYSVLQVLPRMLFIKIRLISSLVAECFP